MSDSADRLAQLQSFLEAVPFAHLCGMRITEVDEDAQTMRIDMPLAEQLKRAGSLGQFHGGAIAALIDTAGTFVLVMVTEHPPSTIDMRTDYLRPATGDVYAVATVRRSGRTVGFVDVDVTDSTGRLVAIGRCTFSTRRGS
ncbi:MAG: PaaI family thioesterase [Actinomycetota bacterium]